MLRAGAFGDLANNAPAGPARGPAVDLADAELGGGGERLDFADDVRWCRRTPKVPAPRLVPITRRIAALIYLLRRRPGRIAPNAAKAPAIRNSDCGSDTGAGPPFSGVSGNTVTVRVVF